MNSTPTTISSDLIITSHGFGLLRKALIENMGDERAKAFLFRFGRDLGVSKAMELREQYSSIEDLVGFASEIHTNLGHVSGIEANGQINILDDGTLEFISVYGKWFDSFEAKLHLEHYGSSTKCTCHTLSGFASGYLTSIYNEEIYVKEIKCQTMGYRECTFEINSKEHWMQKDSENELTLHNQTIYEELELTYDKLLAQKKMLDKMSTYHSQLTDCVAHENSLYHVLATAYEILKIPIIIKNANNKIIATTGIPENDYVKIMRDAKKKMSVAQHNESVYENYGKIQEMRTPIYLDQKIFATCSFLYNDGQLFDESDYLFLERLAAVAALCFLKEKISFETTERLKISVLDRLINQQFTSNHEISSQLNYVSSNIDGPYFMVSIKCAPIKNHSLPIDLYAQLLQFSETFKLFYIDSLLTLHQSEIVVLIYNGEPIEKFVKDLKIVMAHIQKNNPSIHYKLGISLQFSTLRDLGKHLKQAKYAATLPRNQLMTKYEELGILGHFLSNTNLETIKQTAAEELKELLKEDSKKRELLYTLYTYLVNGKHLEKTMQDLSLSMGGIQYRIRKIEEITQKNLKDFYTASYLLLLIESLITLGEIEW